VTIESPVSQFLSSLLLAAPLTRDGMDISVPILNEKPYVGITLGWLERLGLTYERDEWERFTVPGGQAVSPFEARVPGDFSSATFFATAAAMSGSRLEIRGLDLTDSQGDKEVLTVLEGLGTTVERPRTPGGSIVVSGPGGGLAGGRIDLNAMPDALPALAILGTTCDSPLELVNVPQARQKETDRIAAMAQIIMRLGGRARELEDGLVVEPGRLRGGTADSLGDHRIAMALAIAGLVANAPVTVTNAEVASITFPGFYEKLRGCNAIVAEGGSLTGGDGA
jgi:3-phosphoshikimate 1-carboxyvinyltransferase